MGGKKKRIMGQTITIMDAEKLVKISEDNIPAGRRSPGRLKRRWSDLILD